MKAAAAGEPMAMRSLGVAYEHEKLGLKKDDIAAVTWYQKAADAGNERAKDNLKKLPPQNQR